MRSIPFERPLLPLIYETDCEDAKEDHHQPEAERSQLTDRLRPIEKKTHIKARDDEDDDNEIDTHNELHTSLIATAKAAFVGGELGRVGPPVGHQERGYE